MGASLLRSLHLCEGNGIWGCGSKVVESHLLAALIYLPELWTHVRLWSERACFSIGSCKCSWFQPTIWTCQGWLALLLASPPTSRRGIVLLRLLQSSVTSAYTILQRLVASGNNHFAICALERAAIFAQPFSWSVYTDQLAFARCYHPVRRCSFQTIYVVFKLNDLNVLFWKSRLKMSVFDRNWIVWPGVWQANWHGGNQFLVRPQEA